LRHKRVGKYNPFGNNGLRLKSCAKEENAGPAYFRL